MVNIVVASVMFTETAMEVAFMDVDEDVRHDGQVIATRTYAVEESAPEFGEDVTEIRQLIVDLVEDVHARFGRLPKTTAPPDDEGDDEGMGS